MLDNFTIQEILGSILGFFLFPFVIVIPGYVVGWLLNLFDFRNRLVAVRFLIALILSNAVTPIVLYLAYSLVSADFAIAILSACFVAWLVILIISRKRSPVPLNPEVRRYQNVALALAVAWILFSIVWLVDIQFGDNLYFNSVSYDYTTRVAVTDAMTRTGVPPVNPGYYPGHPEKLTFLYFFWYILTSVVDKIGGAWVDAQAAMTASVAWCGLCLIATIALYLRLRYKAGEVKVWQLSIFASQLLLVSGLDIIPVLALLLKSKLTLGHMVFEGRIEGWNMPIMDWIGGLMWVPLHVSSMLACLTGLMLFLYTYDKDRRQQFIAACIAGIAFASAVGLSVWITFAFAIFWGLWMLALFFGQRRRQMVIFMALAGIVALPLIYPFLAGVTQSSTGSSSGELPIALYIRPFFLLSAYVEQPLLHDILNFVLLPVNYMFELGFFFLVGLLWLQHSKKTGWKDNLHYLAEIILFFTVAITLSFIRSTLIIINDFGIRAWLLGQFVLLIWAVDLFEHQVRQNSLSLFSVFSPKNWKTRNNGMVITIFLTLGILTTALDMVVIRAWPMMIDMNIVGFPNELSPDTQLGQRTYAARLAYDYIRDNTAENVVVQANPKIVLSRPGGLYGSRQTAIADRTAYGVPVDQYKSFVTGISTIFLSKNITTWDGVDDVCERYFIDIIIVNDVDPLWNSLTTLKQERTPLYENGYYALFNCGTSATDT